MGPTLLPGSSCSLNTCVRVSGREEQRPSPPPPKSAPWKYCRPDGRTNGRWKRYKPARYWNDACTSIRDRVLPRIAAATPNLTKRERPVVCFPGRINVQLFVRSKRRIACDLTRRVPRSIYSKRYELFRTAFVSGDTTRKQTRFSFFNRVKINWFLSSNC